MSLACPGHTCLLLEVLLEGILAPSLTPTPAPWAWGCTRFLGGGPGLCGPASPGWMLLPAVWGGACGSSAFCKLTAGQGHTASASQAVPTGTTLETGTPRVGQLWLLSWLLPTPLGPSIWRSRGCGSLGILAGTPQRLAPESLLPSPLQPGEMVLGLIPACSLSPPGLCVGPSPARSALSPLLPWLTGHALGSRQRCHLLRNLPWPGVGIIAQSLLQRCVHSAGAGLPGSCGPGSWDTSGLHSHL